MFLKSFERKLLIVYKNHEHYWFYMKEVSNNDNDEDNRFKMSTLNDKYSILVKIYSWCASVAIMYKK